MGAVVDSIEIQIGSDARKAEQTIDSLIEKMNKLAKSMGSIDVSAISKQAKKISDSFSNVNIKGLENISKSAKQAEESVKMVSSVAKSMGATKMNFNVSDYQKVIKELSGKFSEAGKDINFGGNLESLEKQASRISAELDKLAQKEEKIISVGKISPQSSVFQNLQYDIASATNRLSEIQSKIKNFKKTLPSGTSDSKTISYDADFSNVQKSAETVKNITENVLKTIPESARYSIEESQKALSDALKSVHVEPIDTDSFRNFTKEIDEAKQKLKELEASGMGMGSDAWESAYLSLAKVTNEAKEYKNNLDMHSKGLDVDTEKTSALGNRVEQLKSKLKDLKAQGFNLGDPKFDKVYTELQKSETELKEYKAKLKDAGNESSNFANKSIPSFQKVTSVLKGMGNGALNLAKKMTSVSLPFSNVSKGSSSLTRSLGRLYVAFLSLRGIGRIIKESIDISSSLTEVQNVVDVTFGKYSKAIEDFAQTSVQQFGLSELSAKQTAGRYQSMGVALGLPQKEMANMSVELTKLSADLASFYDVSQSETAKSLQSVFTGTTMPMRKYGVDLTQTTIEEWAHKRGIDAKMKSMSQAEKMMIRYQYVMERTGAAQGDFARTINSWHNQVTLLKEGFKELGGVIGGVFINALKPIVKGLNAAMGHIINFAKMISNALGKIFGWTYEEGGGATNPAEDLSEGMDDVADATDNATKKQKEFNKQLSKFDELNNYTQDKSKDNDTGGGSGDLSGTGAGGYGGQWKKGDSIVKAYESEISSLYGLGAKIGDTLKKAMDSIDWEGVYKKAEGFGTGLANFLNGLVETPGLFSSIGTTIAGGLNAALHFLDSFGKTFNWSAFGQGIADGINAFFKTFDFKLLASTFNTWANGLLTTMITAVQGVDWKLVASKIAELINGIDAKGISWNLGKLVGSLANAFYTLVSNKETWTALGTKIADGINGFFSGMNDVDPKTGLTGFQALGKSISESISGIAGTITTALETVDWEEVGRSIGDFISSIDFGKIAISFVGLGKAVWGAVTGAISGDQSGFLKVAAIIGAAFAAPKVISAISGFVTLLSGIAGVATTVVGGISSIATTISTAVGSISAFGTTVSTVLGISTTAVAGIAAGIVGAVAAIVDLWNTSTTFRTAVTDAFNKVKNAVVSAVGNITTSLSGVGTVILDLLKNLKDFYDNSPLKSIIALVASLAATLAGNIISTAINLIGTAFSSLVKIAKGVITVISGIVETITGLATLDASKIVSGVKKIASGLGTAFSGVIGGIKEIGINLMNGFLGGIESIAKTISSWFKEHVLTPIVNVFSNLWTGITTVFSGASTWFTNIFTTAWSGVKTAWNGATQFFSGIWTGITNVFSNVGNWFKTKFSTAWTNIKSAWNSTKTFFSNVWTGITNVFSNVGNWFKTKFSTAWTNIKNSFSNVKTFFKGVWSNITGVFGNVASWFEDKFSKAWKAVKDVFSTGGKVFDGIKDGILNGLKTVINGLIKGINKVIAVPFKGLNTALTKIKNVSIAGKKPFDKLISTIDVPQIPEFATGGFPEDGWFRASQGEIMGKFDNGQSVVANNMQITKGISDAVQKGNQESVMLMRQEISVLQRQNDLLLGILQKDTGISKSEVFNAVRDEDNAFYKRNGHSAFSW